MAKEKSAAVLTLHNAKDYSDSGAKDIAAWLRRQAKFVLQPEFRNNVASRYTARYLYKDNEETD